MAQKAKADVPRMRQQIAELKVSLCRGAPLGTTARPSQSREEAILDQDQMLRPPRAPHFGLNPEEEDDYIGSSFESLDTAFSRIKDAQKPGRTTPVDKEKREEMMRKSRERLERMRNMDPDERIAEMRRERDERLAERAQRSDAFEHEDAIKDLESLMGARKRTWRSKSGDYGPPQPRNLGLEKLSTEERHAKLLEHQKLMEEHRSKMDEWREKHEAYMSERRAIMDSYRDLSHQIREAVFASKPLR